MIDAFAAPLDSARRTAYGRAPRKERLRLEGFSQSMIFDDSMLGGDSSSRAYLPHGDSPSEAAQVQRAKEGDQATWDAWFDTFYPKLYRYAFIRLGRKVEAEDVVGQVFLEAVRQIDRFQYTGRPVLAWLYRIAHNLVYDYLKQVERSPEPERAATRQPTAGPEALLANIDLMNALKQLNDDQREVIILRFFLSMSAQEVGVLIEKSPAAVFSLQARAIANLRERLR